MKESINKCEILLNNIPSGIYIFNVTNNKIEFVNPVYSEILGHTLDELKKLLPQEYYDLFHPEEKEKVLQHIKKVAKIKEGEKFRVEFRFKSKNKGWVWCMSQDTPFEFNEDGSVKNYIGSITEIFSYKKTESKLLKVNQKLELSEFNLQRAQTISHLGMWYLDISTNEVQWTEELYKMYGFDSSLPPPPYTEHMKLFTPESWDMLSKSLAKTQDTGEPYELELKTVRKDNSNGWMWVRGEVVKNNKGKTIGLWGAAQDITRQKEIEQSLSAAKQKAEQNEIQFRQLFENMEQGFALHEMIYNDEGKPVDYKYILANKAFGELTGISHEKCIGKSVKEIIPNIESTWIEKYGNVANSCKTFQFEDYVKSLNKHYSVITYSPRKGFFATVFTDITEIKKYQEYLVKEKEVADKSNQLKSAFLANMSHEIRTPMNAITGFASFLKDRSQTRDDIDNFADVITDAGNHLLNLINDVIDISKIDAGQIEVSNGNADVNKVIREVYTMFHSQLVFRNNFNIHLKLNCPNKELYTFTDETRLKQIIINLVGNALKFTEEGSIEIGYELKETELQFYVKDTGIGISKDKQELIFERFQQANNTTEKLYGGTGLGLAISKACVELLGGNLWVESELGQGSTFFFTIKYLPGIKETIIDEPDTQIRRDFNKELILIAEDDDLNYEYLLTVLKNSNLEVIRTTTGRSTIEQALNSDTIKLILMDINMPDINGVNAAIEIKKHKPHLPIIAQTAYAMNGDRQKFIDMGCNEYLAKPINQKDLLRTLNKFICIK